MDLGSGLTYISGGAFISYSHQSISSKSKITNLTIPSNVTTIEDSAFEGVPLTNITIQGTQNRFNSRWTQIGFSAELKPVN